MPAETVLLTYILVTGVLIIVFNGRLKHEIVNLLLRFVIIVFVIFLIALNRKYSTNKVIRFIRLFFPFLLLAYFYKETDYLNNIFIVNNLDDLLSSWEESIFRTQPSLAFAAFFSSDLMAELMYFGYFSYYLLVFGIPLYIFFIVDKYLGEKYVFVIITSFIIYYLVFIVFPVAGPQYYYSSRLLVLPAGYFFGPFIRLIQYYGEAPTAAFPSSHVSICIMLLWICFRHVKKLLIFTLPISVLLLFSTVYIRAHYVIDVIGGLICTPLIYTLSEKLFVYLNNKLTNEKSYQIADECTYSRSKKSA
jgi:membrane-associated phospholipid phosphatase